jgi:hypothetical protein
MTPEEQKKRLMAILANHMGDWYLNHDQTLAEVVPIEALAVRLYDDGVRIVDSPKGAERWIAEQNKSFAQMPRPVPKPSQTKKTRGKKTIDEID